MVKETRPVRRIWEAKYGRKVIKGKTTRTWEKVIARILEREEKTGMIMKKEEKTRPTKFVISKVYLYIFSCNTHTGARALLQEINVYIIIT